MTCAILHSMRIDVEESPNGCFSEQFVFKELGKPRPVLALRAQVSGGETLCDVTGVETGGKWVRAYGVKVADSSEGHAYLIYGGLWGIRLRPKDFVSENWDFSSKNQWGEPFKVYGSEEDIVYAGE